MFLSRSTIASAIDYLRGSASHFLKIWLVLKKMGLTKSDSVLINTSNSANALQSLFYAGAPDGSFFVPFGKGERFTTMKHDAARSIIQTNAVRWAESKSVVTVDPSSYLKFEKTPTGEVRISCTNSYPKGLGYSLNGFAVENGAIVSVGLLEFAVWYFRQREVPARDPSEWLVTKLIEELNLSPSEIEVIFKKDTVFPIELVEEPVTDEELWSICQGSLAAKASVEVRKQDRKSYLRRLRSVTTMSSRPTWIDTPPEEQLADAIASGEKTLLLYGPPRTGKTRAIDKLYERPDNNRATIQLHDGWGYENLIMGLIPTGDETAFTWQPGALLQALRTGDKVIVLEEINRTRVSQALGEAFSLLEPQYRGVENAIALPDGSEFYIDPEVTFFLTMNTIDASTEAIDDALLGRIASINFSPRIEDLVEMLGSRTVDAGVAEKIQLFFAFVQDYYPLGHGYFAGIKPGTDFKKYYLWKIRPVIDNRFALTQPELIEQIDNYVDELFS